MAANRWPKCGPRPPTLTTHDQPHGGPRSDPRTATEALLAPKPLPEASKRGKLLRARPRERPKIANRAPPTSYPTINRKFRIKYKGKTCRTSTSHRPSVKHLKKKCTHQNTARELQVRSLSDVWAEISAFVHPPFGYGHDSPGAPSSWRPVAGWLLTCWLPAALLLAGLLVRIIMWLFRKTRCLFWRKSAPLAKNACIQGGAYRYYVHI